MDLLMLAAGATAPATRSAMDDITTFSLILMAAFAVLVVIGIVVGARLKRRRDAGMAEFEREEQAELDRQHAGQVPTPAPAASPVDEPPEAVPATPDGDGTDAPLPERGAFSAPSPAPDAPPAPSSPAAPATDSGELTQLKGLGPKVAAAMAEAGVTSLAQLAALSPGQAADLDARLGAFQGRMARDRWVEQARLLSAGDRSGYEAAFGKLG